MNLAKRTINLLAAVVVPLVVQTFFLIIDEALGPGSLETGSNGIFALSLALGFVFLVRALGIYAVPVGLIYLPVMFGALIALALAYASGV